MLAQIHLLNFVCILNVNLLTLDDIIIIILLLHHVLVQLEIIVVVDRRLAIVGCAVDTALMPLLILVTLLIIRLRREGRVSVWVVF